MWVAFDKSKLMICRDNPDGSISDVLERARQTKARPLVAKVHDVDDVTHKVRQTWDGCLVAGKDEATARALVASMFGEDWAYEGKYPARFLVAEVPDSMTFGCSWIVDAVDKPPRAVAEA